MKISRLLLLATLAITPTLSQAASVYSDNFNSYTGGLNWAPQGGWNVTDGTVDLIGTTTPWDFFPAYGRFIDLDGSSGDSGLLSHAINLVGGTTYNFSFDLAGSQRGSAESVLVNFGSTSQSYSIGSSDVFTTFLLSFTPTTSGAYSISFQNSGNDNVGALLDNVSVDSVSQPSAVPLPAALPLMLSGLGVLGFAARRKKETG